MYKDNQQKLVAYRRVVGQPGVRKSLGDALAPYR